MGLADTGPGSIAASGSADPTGEPGAILMGTDDTGDTGFPVVTVLFTVSMSSSWLILLALVSLEEPFVCSLIIVGKLATATEGKPFFWRTLLYMSECSSSTVEI